MGRRQFWHGSGARRPGQTVRPVSARTTAFEADREAARTRPAGEGLKWIRMDLHIHTPASADYRDPGISYLDILKKAEEKGLDMIAFTDHNTVAGYASMHREIETLTLLERLNRLTDEERTTLNEYRRLLSRIVVLPGFEFTATFGFHVLGIFPENTSVRKLEYLLLSLNVPEDKMVAGAPDAGATADVLTAYQAIAAAGGLAIAAHANSSNGVAMQGFPFGGQTKIAYTQDPNLAALEVTDLESTSRRSTAAFFNGTKPEYPRRMHCIQGSDAHSLETEQADSANKRLGVGARITEILVKEASFAALKEVLTGTDFTRVRPYRSNALWDEVEAARLQGPGIHQSFHERAVTKTSRTRPILHDVIAFANGEGGTIYVGANPDTRVPLHGLEQAEEQARILKEDIFQMIDPPINVEFEIRPDGDRGIIVIRVPQGPDRPYVFAPTGQIYVRRGKESVLATREEIIRLVIDSVRDREREGWPIIPSDRRPLIVAAGTAAVGEPLSAPQFVPRARADRDRDREQNRDRAYAPSAQAPAEERQDQRQAYGPESEPERRPEREPQPQPQPQPQAPRRTISPAALMNLPPEKIKGQIQPMVPRVLEHAATGATGAATEPQPPALSPAPQAPAQAVPESEGTAVAGELTATAVPESQLAGQPAQAVQAVEEAAPKKGRSRRKKVEPQAQATADEAQTAQAEPMEATMAAEHKTREEIVATEGTGSKRGKRKTARRTEAELQVEAPTAAAAATDAGTQAMLVEAQVEPGPQIPAELPTLPLQAQPQPQPQPETTEKKSRARRRKATGGETPPQPEAQAQAPATSEAAPPAEAQIQAEAPAPPTTRQRGRTRKKQASAAQEAVAPEPGAQGAQGPVIGPEMQAGQAQSAAAVVEPPPPPTNGVEIISTEQRGGTNYHVMRDLRNMTTVRNVTRQSARRLWHYAIVQHEHGTPQPAEVFWHPQLPVGLWRRGERAGAMRYDLIARYPDGSTRIFYGVTEDGLHGPWREVVSLAEEAGYAGPPPAEG